MNQMKYLVNAHNLIVNSVGVVWLVPLVKLTQKKQPMVQYLRETELVSIRINVTLD